MRLVAWNLIHVSKTHSSPTAKCHPSINAQDTRDIYSQNAAKEAPYPWVKNWMVHVMPKLIYHANVKHLETKNELERTRPWFETLKHWKQPTCCFSSRFVLNRGYCAKNRPCQKAWNTNWRMLAYIIYIMSNVVFLFPQGSGWKLQTQHHLKTTTFSLYN